MSVVVFPRKTKNLVSGLTTAEYVPFTRWIPAIAIKEVKTLLEMAGSPNFRVTAAIQVADTDRNSPGAWTDIGSYLTENGANNSGLVNVSTTVDGKFWVRFGVGVKNSTGTSLERGEVSLTVSARS